MTDYFSKKKDVIPNELLAIASERVQQQFARRKRTFDTLVDSKHSAFHVNKKRKRRRHDKALDDALKHFGLLCMSHVEQFSKNRSNVQSNVVPVPNPWIFCCLRLGTVTRCV